MQYVLPDRAVPQTYKTGIPTIIIGVDPRTRRVVHRPLGRGVRGLVQRLQGHGRVGCAQRELRQPLEGDRRDQRVALPAHPVEPRLPHRLAAGRANGAASAAATTRRKCASTPKVYTYVVGMKYPMPGICGGTQRLAQRDDPPLRQRRRVQGRSTPPTGSRCRPASASCSTTAAAAVGAIPSTATRRPCSTTCSTSTCRSRARAATTAWCSTGSLEDLTLEIDEVATLDAPRTSCGPNEPEMGFRVGVDVGGTFTDLICVTPAGEIVLDKTPTTLDDQSTGVMNGLEQLADRFGVELDRVLPRPRHPRARHHHRRQHDDRDERRAHRACS